MANKPAPKTTPARITARVKSEAGKVLGDKTAFKIDRSLAGEVLRQSQTKPKAA